jgi:hypothetical protein
VLSQRKDLPTANNIRIIVVESELLANALGELETSGQNP